MSCFQGAHRTRSRTQIGDFFEKNGWENLGRDFLECRVGGTPTAASATSHIA